MKTRRNFTVKNNGFLNHGHQPLKIVIRIILLNHKAEDPELCPLIFFINID